jgi:hypothetical protein
MKFDITLGNPPYNTRADGGGTAGTTGDKTLYRKFTTSAFNVTKKGGKVVMVVPKGILQHFDNKLPVQVDEVNLMTDVDYWKYDTLYFVARNEPKTTDIVFKDKIVSKMYASDNPWNAVLQGSSLMHMERDSGVVVSEDGDVLLKLEGDDPAVYGTNTDNVKVYHGPKFMCTILESLKSYTATDEPAYPHCACVVKTGTLEEAEKLKLFVENNKAWKFATKRLKSKGHGKELRRLKRFDLSQITTGFEYPREFALTEEDIKIIEDAL